jgi:hypothetical protein
VRVSPCVGDALTHRTDLRPFFKPHPVGTCPFVTVESRPSTLRAWRSVSENRVERCATLGFRHLSAVHERAGWNLVECGGEGLRGEAEAEADEGLADRDDLGGEGAAERCRGLSCGGPV